MIRFWRVTVRQLIPRFVFLISVLGTLSAQADLPKRSFQVGIFGGATLALDDWDLHEVTDAGISPKLFTPTLGVRLGGTIGYWVTIEASLAALLITSEQDKSNTALTYRGNVLVNLMPSGDWVPFLTAGGGAYHSISSDFGPDLDYRVDAGVGVRGLLTDWLILRVDLNYVLTDGYDEGHFGNNLELLLGLDFIAWQAGEDDDWDNDGILNPDDKCPRVPGHKSGEGCPDRDGDTVLDDVDDCPDTPGPVEHKGCPDTDGDGILDKVDKCPQTPGIAQFDGCPDTDGDGLQDSEDRCPKTPGPIDKKGCPDRDGDGIVDIDDRCPDVPGIPELQGCPKDKPMVLEGVGFLYNSATLTDEARQGLNGVAKTMKEFPKLTARVVGYTSSEGTTEKNQDLSQRRARSVKEYLVGQGIDASRLQAVGRGESNPRASNADEAGRAKNRRIEFELLSK